MPTSGSLWSVENCVRLFEDEGARGHSGMSSDPQPATGQAPLNEPTGVAADACTILFGQPGYLVISTTVLDHQQTGPRMVNRIQALDMRGEPHSGTITPQLHVKYASGGNRTAGKGLIHGIPFPRTPKSPIRAVGNLNFP